jgi:hypothetical protein
MNFPLCYNFRKFAPIKDRELDDAESELLRNLKLFLFFKVNVKEADAKQTLLRADQESRNNQLLADWLRNIGVRAVSQYGGERKITSWKSTLAQLK